jgi:hypothetical protein
MKKLTIQAMQQLAESQGGKCLSDVYVNAQSKLLWQCAEGHRWTARPDMIQQGQWCPYCAGVAKLTIDAMHRLAETKGGKCLSDTYVDSRTPILWECSEGHRWKAIASNVKRGHWCPVCAGCAKPLMDDMQRLANERGGKCLSQSYRNAHTLLNWECIEGHQWKANWNNISNGRWCPTCSTGLGERICREFFSQLFQSPFPKTRPEWLVNKAGNQMELDGYCAALGIAFEHHGEQHYTTKTRFIDSEAVLAKRQEDDALKSKVCAERGITLLAIPGIPDLLPLDQVRAFIKEQLSIKGVQLPQDFDTRHVDINRAYCTGGSREALEYLRTIAIEHGGRLLSDVYAGSQSKPLWQCARGHEWEATPDGITQGKWCPKCGGTLRRTLEEMQEIAAARGGKCLSPAYLNGRTKLLWGCARGHQWEATPSHVVSGGWCPYCYGRGKTIQDMQQLAAKRGGKCLSPAYERNRTKLLWECSRGHQWEACPIDVAGGSWCPYCVGRGKTIEDMRHLATQNGGQCLSLAFVNTHTQLLWQCAEGHNWRASPDSIRRGSWCPVCTIGEQGLARRLGLPAMQSLAASRGGRCLSHDYVNSLTHLLWQCNSGHQWRATPNNVKRGTWCPVCAEFRKRTIEDMRNLAAQHGGQCLSGVYKGNKTRLLWQCKAGHQWEAIPHSVLGGTWCPVCGRRRAWERRKAR